MNHFEEFAERLSELLIVKEIDIKTLSAGTGITGSGLYGYLSGEHVPTTENAIKICDYFQCSLDYLFGFRDDYIPKQRFSVAAVCDRVRAAIDSSGKTRYRLSQETHIHQADIALWYHGQRTPSLVSLVKLVEPLNCSLDFLAGRE